VLLCLKHNHLNYSRYEQENEALRRANCEAVSQSDIQDLHNELIACKLREAESNMASKQLQNELFEIQRLWQVCSGTIFE